MHKSRLCGFVIDCRTDDLNAAADFWSRVFGRDPDADPEYPHYVSLNDRPGEPHIEIQRVDHDSRVHLDIETDDVEAETQRLEKLGATRIRQIRDWQVMQAPTGHRFCIVPAVAPDFNDKAKVWG